MTISELNEAIQTAFNVGIDGDDMVVFKTPHGTYTFSAFDVVVGLQSGSFVVRLQEIEREE